MLNRLAAALALDNNPVSSQQQVLPNITFPKFYIERAILENKFANNESTDNNSEENMFCDLLMATKIRYTGEESLLEFFKSDQVRLYLLRVQSETWKQIIQESSELMLKLINFKKGTPPEAPHIQQYFLARAQNKGLIKQLSSQEFCESFYRVNELKEIPSMNAVAVNGLLDNGEPGFEYYIRFKDTLHETEHLSYFLCADYKEAVTNTNPYETKITGEMIINKGKLASLTYVFYDKNENIWTGDVYKMEGVWYKGKLSDRGVTESLNRVGLYNKKIQDFRVFQKLSKTADITNTFYTANKLLDEYSLKKHDETTISQPGVGQFIISNEIGKQSNSGQFVYQLKKTDQDLIRFKEKGARGPIFHVVPARIKEKSYIYNSLRVTPDFNFTPTFSVYKIRTKTRKNRRYAHATYEYLELFTKNEKKRYIAGQPVETGVGSMTYNINDVLYGLEEGEYCYGIEMIYDDPYFDSFSSRVGQIREYYNYLLSYYQMCSLGENYNLLLNKFTQSFIDWYKAQESKYTIHEILGKYQVALSMLTGEDVADEEANAIIASTLPESGTPVGVGIFVDSYSRILYILEKILKKARTNRIQTYEKVFDNIGERDIKLMIEEDMELMPTQVVELDEVTAFQTMFSTTLLTDSGEPLIDDLVEIKWDKETQQAIERPLKQEAFQQVSQFSQFSMAMLQQGLQPIKMTVSSYTSEPQKYVVGEKAYARYEAGQNFGASVSVQSNIKVENATMLDSFYKAKQVKRE